MTEAVLEATTATVESTETVDAAATTEAEASTQAADAATAPELTLNDLAVLRQIIEVASQRGAFKAAELEAVGKAFNKLSAFKIPTNVTLSKSKPFVTI
jgi:hypothetical protein